MFEGKHIHFSPTDNKPLCSYSGKLCRQRRLNGYAFCIRHILEDKSAPFKQCIFVTRNNSQKCLNAIPTNQDRGYCHSHMQVVGIIPKTERKPKTASKSDNNNTASGVSSTGSSPPSSGNSVKKDPGAVFKFEEDSSDTTGVFSYKNSLSNAAANGKSKGSKGKDRSSGGSQKDIKHVKSPNGFNSTTTTTTFTTKKITDRNKNVYTAIIPNTKGLAHSKNKNGSWNGSSDDVVTPTTQQRPFSRMVQLASASLRNHKDNIGRGGESELNKLDDIEIRHFEQLKTLKQLDKSLQPAPPTSDDVAGGNAKFKSFPRLSPPKHETNAGSRDTNLQSATSSLSANLTTLQKSERTEATTKSVTNAEKAFASPAPPAVTLIGILKTDSDPDAISRNNNNVDCEDENSQKQQLSGDRGFLLSSGNNEDSNISSCNNDNDHCSSILCRDLKSRHEFLVHVRNSFKSQYNSIKKACRISERYEENTKEKFRDSLMRCVKIDSSICAQVLSGYGLKFPVSPSPMKIEVETTKDSFKSEYDDYEFFDNDGVSSTKASTASADHKSKKSIAKKNNDMKESNVKGNVEDRGKAKQKRFNFSAVKGKNVDPLIVSESSNDGDMNNAHSSPTASSKPAKVTKQNDKVVALKESSKSKQPTPSSVSKKRPKRDTIVISSESSKDDSKKDGQEQGVSGLHSNSPKKGVGSVSVVGKKRRLGITTLASVGTELGLTLNGRSSPGLVVTSGFDVGDHIGNTSTTEGVLLEKCEKVDERVHSSNHPPKNPGVGNSINDIHHDLRDILSRSQHTSSAPSHRNQGLETVLNSVGSSENAGTPDGVITDASFDSTFEHSTSSQPDCEFSEDDLEQSFELIDPEIESQASRLLEDNVLTEADFTELFPDNRMSDHKFGRNDLQELGMAGLEFDVNDIDYSLFANIFPNFPRTSQPESISISNQF